MRYNGFEREKIAEVVHPSLDNLEKYARFSEIQPILGCLKTCQEETLGRYSHHRSRFVRQQVAKYATSEAILNDLKTDSNYFVRAEALRNQYCRIVDSDIIGVQNYGNEFVLAAIAEHANLLREHKEILLRRAIELNSFIIRFQLIRYQTWNEIFVNRCKEDFDHYGLTLAEVLNPTLSLHRVEEIINETNEKEILVAIGRNFPSVEVQKKLRRKEDSDVDIAMIQSGTLSEEVLAELVQSPDFEVRAELSKYPCYRETVLNFIDQLEY